MSTWMFRLAPIAAVFAYLAGLCPMTLLRKSTTPASLTPIPLPALCIALVCWSVWRVKAPGNCWLKDVFRGVYA